MVINIWTYFINGIGAFSSIFGTVTMTLTHAHYDNYILAKSEYAFIESYNKHYDVIQNMPSNVFENYMSIKYADINIDDAPSTRNINLNIFRGFKEFKDFKLFLKTKIVKNKKNIDQMNTNVSSDTFIDGLRVQVKNIINQKTNNSPENLNQPGLYPQEFVSSLETFYTSDAFDKIYKFDKTPEIASMIAGIAFTVSGFAIIVGYWGFFLYKQNKDKK